MPSHDEVPPRIKAYAYSRIARQSPEALVKEIPELLTLLSVRGETIEAFEIRRYAADAIADIAFARPDAVHDVVDTLVAKLRIEVTREFDRTEQAGGAKPTHLVIAQRELARAMFPLLIEDPSPVREITDTLAEIADLTDAILGEVIVILHILARHDPDVVQPYEEIIARGLESNRDAVRAVTAATLGVLDQADSGTGVDYLDKIVPLLRSPKRGIRVNASGAIAAIGSHDTGVLEPYLDELLEAISDTDTRVVNNVVRVLLPLVGSNPDAFRSSVTDLLDIARMEGVRMDEGNRNLPTSVTDPVSSDSFNNNSTEARLETRRLAEKIAPPRHLALATVARVALFRPDVVSRHLDTVQEVATEATTEDERRAAFKIFAAVSLTRPNAVAEQAGFLVDEFAADSRGDGSRRLLLNTLAQTVIGAPTALKPHVDALGPVPTSDSPRTRVLIVKIFATVANTAPEALIPWIPTLRSLCASTQTPVNIQAASALGEVAVTFPETIAPAARPSVGSYRRSKNEISKVAVAALMRLYDARGI